MTINLVELLDLAVKTNNEELATWIKNQLASNQPTITKKRAGRPPKKVADVQQVKPNKLKTVKKSVSKASDQTNTATQKVSRIIDLEQFKTNTVSKKRSTPIRGTGQNLWQDDGIAEKNELNVTPNIPPVKREREKYSLKRIECTSCKNQISVKPIHVRENFICDECIIKKGRVRE
jgi:hypothetical protein